MMDKTIQISHSRKNLPTRMISRFSKVFRTHVTVNQRASILQARTSTHCIEIFHLAYTNMGYKYIHVK